MPIEHARFNRPEFDQLVQDNDDRLHLTLQMPTVMAGREVQQNSIRFKNLISQAEGELQARGNPDHELRKTVRGLSKLGSNDNFWQHQDRGLAVFVKGDTAKLCRVPVELNERVVFGERFFVSSMLPLLQDDGLFYLLAVSEKDVRLLSGTRDSISRMPTDTLPDNLQSLLAGDSESRSFLLHSFRVRMGGDDAAVPHGHEKPDREAETFRYLRMIDDGLREVVEDEKTPLVFAGVEELRALFKEASTYRGLTEDFVRGNVDHLSDKELHDKAWPIVEPIFHATIETELSKLGDAAAADRAAESLEEALVAAQQGQIDTLLVAEGATQWGRFDADSLSVSFDEEPTDSSEPLIDRVIALVIRNSGRVYSVDPDRLPDSSPVHAILRYPRVANA